MKTGKLLRGIIGWPIILLSYVGVFMTLNPNSSMYTRTEPFSWGGVFWRWAIIDVVLFIASRIAGIPSGRKAHFTNVILAILTYAIVIVIYPFMHMLQTVRLFFGYLLHRNRADENKAAKESDKAANSGEEGWSKLRNKVHSICDSRSGDFRINTCLRAECQVTPKYFSHLITLDVSILFHIDNSQIKDENGRRAVEQDMEKYCKEFNMAQTQQDILTEIKKLAKKYDDLTGEWKVSVGEVKVDTKENG